MICASCLRRASVLRSSPSSLRRQFASSRTQFAPQPTSQDISPTAISSTTPAQLFTSPLSTTSNSVSTGISLKSKANAAHVPISSCPAGTPLKGLNYLKGRDDPLSLPEEEYPEWLWRCLDVKKKTEGGDGDGEGDEFSKSKKLRRKAAKRQRKLEARLLASGNAEALAPKIPITKQSIDLPANEGLTVGGALEAEEKRQEVRRALRKERRGGIKERNFLGSM